ncbi:MAG: beta-ketoacyl-ACP synthase [Hyphomicrobiaceae bacterium]|nr:beta-ketoacyl-ACP synthase [Hyphomicrobiaceae bacterium]
MASSVRDHRGRPVAVVTGMGIVTSLGRGKAENWAGLAAGRSGLKRITRFPTDGLKSTVAGTVDFMDVSPYSAHDLSLAMAMAAVEEAFGEARIETAMFPGPLIVATPPSEFEWPLLRQLYEGSPEPQHGGYRRLLAAARTGNYRGMARHLRFASIADGLKEKFGCSGEPVSICTACASGTTTIQLGMEAIRRGQADAALCIGADATVHPEGLIRFSLLSALSTQNDPPEKASRPFSKNRDGFVIAEGAAALVLESYDAARARGATVLGVVRGCGEKADDFHRTRSRPDGAAIIGAIRKTLGDAGVAPDEIDYINAHGTSTPENDKMEYLSLKAVLGDHLARVPISSNKSMVGHTLIAAGSVEAVFSLLTLRNGLLPPTINYDVPDPDIPLDVVPNAARAAAVKTVLSNSFGFGGQNACVVFSGEPA